MFDSWNGALLVAKPEGITSFGVIERLQRTLMDQRGIKRKFLPKVGHGGTLDPFATGLLVVCVGQGVKLARYFLGSSKVYEGVIRFGERTASGDPTTEIVERTDVVPMSREPLQAAATLMTREPYYQTPPMHSAKKRDGKPLYELARQGIEVEREAKELTLFEFDIQNLENARSAFCVRCSSGTYVRTLAQDLAVKVGSVGMLDSLNRLASGEFNLGQALPLQAILDLTTAGNAWNQLSAWVPFDRMLGRVPRVEASKDEALALMRGQQGCLTGLIARAALAADEELLAIYGGAELVAVARRENGAWGLERVFAPTPPAKNANARMADAAGTARLTVTAV